MLIFLFTISCLFFAAFSIGAVLMKQDTDRRHLNLAGRITYSVMVLSYPWPALIFWGLSFVVLFNFSRWGIVVGIVPLAYLNLVCGRVLIWDFRHKTIKFRDIWKLKPLWY